MYSLRVVVILIVVSLVFGQIRDDYGNIVVSERTRHTYFKHHREQPHVVHYGYGRDRRHWRGRTFSGGHPNHHHHYTHESETFDNDYENF